MVRQQEVSSTPVLVECFSHTKKDVVLVCGNFKALIEDFLGYASRWESTPDGLDSAIMRQGLSAAALHMSCRPWDEFAAWTLNLKQPATNFFWGVDNDTGLVTGRVVKEGVKTFDSSRLFVESKRPNHDLIQSQLDVVGWDVLEIFKQFYHRSEQSPANFFEIEPDVFLMVLALPATDQDWLNELTCEAARQLLQHKANKVKEYRYRFGCRCNPQTIVQVMQRLYKDRAQDLFLDEPGVEVFCPRCGRRWWIARDDFESNSGRLGWG